MLKFRFALALAAGLLVAGSALGAPKVEVKHRTFKAVAHATAKVAVKLPRGGYDGLKGIAYGVLFVAEPVADVGNMAFTGLDNLVSVEFGKKYDPIHYVAVGFAYADEGIEKAQDFLFGAHD